MQCLQKNAESMIESQQALAIRLRAPLCSCKLQPLEKYPQSHRLRHCRNYEYTPPLFLPVYRITTWRNGNFIQSLCGLPPFLKIASVAQQK